MQYSKQKDSAPLETVQKIKNILKNAGIDVQETDWLYANSGMEKQPVYVKRVFLNNPELGANGKGATEEYGLASAYAELIERLQNIYIGSAMDVKIPDAKFVPQEAFIKGHPKIADEAFFRWLYQRDANTDIDLLTPFDKVIKDLQALQDYNKDKPLECVPFYSLNKKNIVYLPLKIITRINSTNGMAAGNTPEEALIQGLSEIIERYVQKNIYLNNLNPPLIPENEYSQYDEITDLIRFYESVGIKVQIRDASMGENFPAVCVIFIDTRKTQYSMKFSAATSLPVAIERCLTEYAQCQDFRNAQSMLPHYPITHKKSFFDYNVFEKDVIFNAYAFAFNNSVFKNENSWSYDKNTWVGYDNSNKNNLKKLIDLIMKKSFDVYIRDVSFLGFPTYHIHIPQMSNFILNVPLQFKRELDEVKPYLKQYLPEYPFKHAISCVFRYNDEINLGLSMVDRDYVRAEEYIDKIINKTPQNDLNSIKALNCFKEYLKLKQDNWTDEQAKDVLQVFFGEVTTNHILQYCVYSNYFENVMKQITANIGAGLKTEHIKNVNDILAQLSHKLTVLYSQYSPAQEKIKVLFE